MKVAGMFLGGLSILSERSLFLTTIRQCPYTYLPSGEIHSQKREITSFVSLILNYSQS
jgi:hypothetical protein